MSISNAKECMSRNPPLVCCSLALTTVAILLTVGGWYLVNFDVSIQLVLRVLPPYSIYRRVFLPGTTDLIVAQIVDVLCSLSKFLSQCSLLRPYFSTFS